MSAEQGDKPIKPAATVLLVRDHPDGLQVFLQRRVRQMTFAAGMTVFPGGGVDPSDVPDAARWAGPGPAEWATRIGTDAATAGQLVSAAVRELFEESGVLLAGDPGTLPAEAAAWRKALVGHSASLAEVLVEADRVLRADLLGLWAHWITPAFEPRRYDTVFFMAVLPEGQEADAHTTEAVEADWWRPQAALDAFAAGDLTLMPPTLLSLRDLAEFGTTAEAVAAPRDLTPIHPTFRDEDGVRLVVLPDGSAHPVNRP